MTTNLIDVEGWCADRAAGFRDRERDDLTFFAQLNARDAALVEWTVKCLGNPDLDGAAQVVALLAERHGWRR